jgi:ubiquinol oxidase
MISTRAATRGSTASSRVTTQLIKSFHTYNAGLRPTFIAAQHLQIVPTSQRQLSSSSNGQAKLKEFFEKHPTEKVRKTHAAWPHPGTYFNISSRPTTTNIAQYTQRNS